MRRPAPPTTTSEDPAPGRSARWRRPLAVTTGLALLALGGCSGGASNAAEPSAAGPGATSAATTRSTDGSACAADDLHVGTREPGAGTDRPTVLLTFTDTGASPCTLSGFPQVSLVASEGGAPLGAPALPSGRARSVTVLPGTDTTSVLRLLTGGPPTAACRPTTAAGLRVVPPGSTTPTFVRYEQRVCGDVDAAPTLRVQSVGTTVL